MLTTATVQNQSTTQNSNNKYTADYLFVVQLHNGKFVIGASNNPGKTIASLNTGYYNAVPKALQVNRIIGIKDQTEERNLMKVVSTFCDKYTADNVIVI